MLVSRFPNRDDNRASTGTTGSFSQEERATFFVMKNRELDYVGHFAGALANFIH